jgi:Glycosyl transferase family 2
MKRLVPSRARQGLRSVLHHAVREAVVGPLAAVQSEVQSDLARLRVELAAIAEHQAELANRNQVLHDQVSSIAEEVRGIVRADFDGIPALRRQLLAARADDEYRMVFAEPVPLVTVRIATHDRARILTQRTIPSVLTQTYPNVEVIVVGDGCEDDTAERIANMGDPRVRFVAMPHRGVYPEDARKSWMVAGAPAMNAGAQLAAGQWIAPLDDDDEFLPNHIEILLDTALAGRFEMVYGKANRITTDGTTVVGDYPPRLAKFSFIAAMYMTPLRFFEWDVRSWVLDEPADWTLCRRMLESGVRIGFVDQVVTNLYPTGPRIGEGS